MEVTHLEVDFSVSMNHQLYTVHVLLGAQRMGWFYFPSFALKISC